mgnify:FL=1
MTKHEPRIDPDSIDWAFNSELPSAAKYAAAVCLPDQEELLADLVGWSLHDSYWESERRRILDRMTELNYHGGEVDRLTHELLAWNNMEVPVDIYIGIVPGSNKETGQPVIGVIGFYVREEE